MDGRVEATANMQELFYRNLCLSYCAVSQQFCDNNEQAKMETVLQCNKHAICELLSLHLESTTVCLLMVQAQHSFLALVALPPRNGGFVIRNFVKQAQSCVDGTANSSVTRCRPEFGLVIVFHSCFRCCRITLLYLDRLLSVLDDR